MKNTLQKETPPIGTLERKRNKSRNGKNLRGYCKYSVTEFFYKFYRY